MTAVKNAALRRPRRSRATIFASVAVSCAIGLTAAGLSTSPAGQPPTNNTPELISRVSGVNGAPYLLGSTRPSISALGHRVAFSTEEFVLAGEFFVVDDFGHVRDRPPAQTLLDSWGADVIALSDDGCVAATSVHDADATVDFGVVDICGGGSWNVPSPNFYAAAPLPGIDQTGSTVAYPTFGQLRVFNRSDGYQSFDVLVADQGAWNFFDVALSDSGGRVAAIAQPVIIRFAPAPAAQEPPSGALFVGDTSSSTVTQIATSSNASSPSWDGSGNLLAYHDDEGVKVYDWSTGQSTLVVPGGREAHISRDGRHLTYTDPGIDTHVYVATRLGSTWSAALETQWVSAGPGVPDDLESRNPVTSEHGRWIAWATSDIAYLGLSGGPDDGAPSVVVRERRPVLTVGSHDFGTITVPAEANVSITNTGPSGWRVTSIAVTAPFALVSHSCPAVLHPAQSCQARVGFAADAVGTSTGSLIVRDDSYPGAPLQAAGRLVGTVPPPPTIPDLGLALEPNPVDFGSVLVGQAGPGRSATLRNTGSAALTVGTVTLGGLNQGDFSTVIDGCSGQILGVGSTCTIDLGFTPAAAGARFATLSANGSGGTFASTSVIGSGRLPDDTTTTTITDSGNPTTTTELVRFFPTLRVSPGSTPSGFVVAVSGAGYPPLDTVQISLGGAAPLSIATDVDGAFELQWLILDGVAQGVYPIDDVATAVYDAQAVEVQVVSSPVRPQGVPQGPRVVRRHVSR